MPRVAGVRRWVGPGAVALAAAATTNAAWAADWVPSASGGGLWFPVGAAVAVAGGAVAAVALWIRLRRREEQLRRVQDRYALALEATAEGLYDWDLEANALVVSARVEAIFGFPATGLRRVEDWHAHILPEDFAAYHHVTVAYFKGRADSITAEYRIVDQRGNLRWIRERSMGLRDAAGRVTRLVGSVGDITELKRAEQALRETHAELERRVAERTEMLARTTATLRSGEERLRGIMGAVVDGIVTVDGDGRVETFNPAAERLFGWTEAEIAGQPVARLLADGTTGLAGLAGRRCELVGRRQDGSAFPLEMSASRLGHGPEGILIGVARDISDRRQAEEALKESERRFRHIFEQSLEGIFQTTPDGHYIDANPALAALYGYRSPDEMKAEVTDIATQIYVDPAARAAYVRAMAEHGQVRDLEYPLRRRDGSIVWVVENSWAVKDEGGSILRYEGTVRDITERKRAEREIAEKSALLSATFENISQAVAIFDQDRRLLGCNSQFVRMLALPPRQAEPGVPLGDIVRYFGERGERLGPADPERRALGDMSADGAAAAKVERTLHTGATVQVAARRIPDGRILITYTDVTDLKQREAELRLSEERYALAARGANDGLLDWDLTSNQVYYSPRWKSMLGCREEDIAGGSEEVFARVHADDLDRVRAAFDSHLSGATTHIEVEYRVRHADGRYRWVLTRGVSVVDPASGRATRIAGSQTDITERKRAEQQLLHDAFHDALTGLPNRALFMDRLGQAVSRAKRNAARTFAVLFLDIDRFKYVNDSLGHSAGDGLIVALARRISGCRRASDTVARLGGDEFAVLLEDLRALEDAVAVADQVQQAIVQPLTLRGQEVFPTASIGIAWGTADYDRPEDVLSDADLAMYRAKAAGKSRYEVFEPGMRTFSIQQLGLETDLRRAFERDELVLYYQPIIDLAEGRIAGFEALMRWRHPVRGLVSPGEFIPLAEETGLIVAMGWWAFGEACRRLKAWGEEYGRPMFMSINVSARQFKDKDLIDNIAEFLQTVDLPPASIKLEITESLLMDNPEVAAEWLRQLKRLDLSLSIDDFGTGYSSLSYLHRFPFDTLKIDRSFISTMTEKRENLEIVRAIIALTHTLGMKVVAEGAERAEEVTLLRQLGCDYVQGFYFARPVPDTEAEALLAADKRWLLAEPAV